MTRTKKYTHAQLRAYAHRLVLREGTPLSTTFQTPASVDDTVNHVAISLAPKLDRERQALLDAVTDRELARSLSNQDGELMGAYGTAGYFVGLAVGLELAAITAEIKGRE